MNSRLVLKLRPLCTTTKLVNLKLQRLCTTVKPNFVHLLIEHPRPNVVHVILNRPDKRNALNSKLWLEIGQCFDHFAQDPECRSIILSGAGKVFSAGLDFNEMINLMQTIGSSDLDASRKGLRLAKIVKGFQSAFTSIEKCQKPVIAAVHGLCLGGALGIITASDIRYSTSDAVYQIKEVEIGIAPDVGHLQRMPKITGNESAFRELTFTGRMFDAEEAYKIGLVSRLFSSKDELTSSALDLAATIATKSPIAVQGSKVNINYSRDHSVQEGLDFMANWNMTMLQSGDVIKAASAIASRQTEPVDFENI